ncbi:AraC family transcriptional regulator [Curvivirga aplysinae]|uniref:AraC family transcriptional regulator n=1 Tax=Curvivirga aplysinae TaxID=2529852 RepID=UPI0012BB82C2|nr:helix-turn-helix transcriptional regulator [Curvivirga aplysinae]MTI09188.1 AraC family transcriptional regulator [Curvivirga aplysinae]
MNLQNQHINETGLLELPQALVAWARDYADGVEIELHHHSKTQLLYASSGVMRLLAGDQAWIVPQNTAVLIPAYLDHAILMHGDVEMRSIYLSDALPRANSSGIEVVAVSPLMRELILALCNEPIVIQPESRGALLSKLLFDELSRMEELSLNIPMPREFRLQKICSLILENPSNQDTLELWSEKIGASSRTISRLFVKDIGISFGRWRQLVRFHHAMEELSKGEAVKVVAAKCGYGSASAFTYAFHREMGINPSSLLSD